VRHRRPGSAWPVRSACGPHASRSHGRPVQSSARLLLPGQAGEPARALLARRLFLFDGRGWGSSSFLGVAHAAGATTATGWRRHLRSPRYGSSTRGAACPGRRAVWLAVRCPLPRGRTGGVEAGWRGRMTARTKRRRGLTARTKRREPCAVCGAGVPQQVEADGDPFAVPPSTSGPVLSSWTGELFETPSDRKEDLYVNPGRSLSEAFQARTGLNPYPPHGDPDSNTAEGLRRAAHPFSHDDQRPSGPRGRGRPIEVHFNACVAATVDYVHRLQRKTRHDRHDFVAATLALMLAGWSTCRRCGRRVTFGAAVPDRIPDLIRRDMDRLCEKVEEAYRRSTRPRIKPPRERIKPPRKRIKPPAS
jgi:hypothetical protein